MIEMVQVYYEDIQKKKNKYFKIAKIIRFN